ncbi:MAG: hypothetical protein KF732_06545 [Flavobacteriales bacterium]|nr:hypothetical protein [Flavobacteriales bacterium]MBV6484684.1 hypothetical protein [Flavobacteriales bacterium]MBX2959601.1 hypothetical protein [Flavobacteriales bacterium]MCL4855844.1 hypothetical protein [Flavobacteriales bacterium]
MCNYKILTENNNGFIVQCLACEHIQLGFGTSLINFSEEDYFDFHLQVRDFLKRKIKISNRKEKCIYLNTYSENSKMVLSYNELMMLTELLTEASNLLIVKNLLYKKNCK